MKKIGIIISLSIIYFSTGCNENSKNQPKKEIIVAVNKLKHVEERKTKINLLEKPETKKFENKHLKNNFVRNKEKAEEPEAEKVETLTKYNPENDGANKTLMTYDNLKKILSNSEIGDTFTHKELNQKFEIPREAVKIVKSITKTAEDEIAVKWKSTWLLEKISDAKFNDGIIKIIFKADKLYTSGNAIGIKHEKKIYNDLIIIGSSAYIPTIKGYHWKIGQ